MRRADPKRESIRPALRAAKVRVNYDARITGSSTAAPVTATVTAETAAAFARDGVACVRGARPRSGRRRGPWPYYNVDGRGISAWIPVDPVPEAGCLQLVAGSHLGPWLLPRTFLTNEARWFPAGSLAALPDIEADRGSYDIRRFELVPGDAVFFDFLTLHGAPGFPFDSRRRVLSLRYLSADARHAPRHWRTSPLFDGLGAELFEARRWITRCSRSSGRPEPEPAWNSRTWSQTRRARFEMGAG
jgi:hypothetical protein